MKQRESLCDLLPVTPAQKIKIRVISDALGSTSFGMSSDAERKDFSIPRNVRERNGSTQRGFVIRGPKARNSEEGIVDGDSRILSGSISCVFLSPVDSHTLKGLHGPHPRLFVRAFERAFRSLC